jgi:ribosomal protein S18 acetylase RimI-like enzyme
VSVLPQPRVLQRERDLAPLVRLLSRLHVEGDYQHPGGMEWWLRRLVQDDFEVHLWYSGADVAAFVVDDAGFVIVRTGQPTLVTRAELLVWAEARLRARGRETIEISVDAADRALNRDLAAGGYESAGTGGAELVRALDALPPVPVLPPGYTMTTLETVDDDTYIALHRAAWSTHAPSSYRRELHDVVTAMPDFRRDMVPIVVAPDGTLAASCIGWIDVPSRSAEIEPLGTHPEHRRLGLATALVHEVARRARERGVRSIMVWGSHNNRAAIQTYTSAGHEPYRTVHELRKPLLTA